MRSRDPIIPGDHVICTLIGDGPSGPFPHYIEGSVVSIHDDFVVVWDILGMTEISVLRHRIITDDQMEELKKKFLLGED